MSDYVSLSLVASFARHVTLVIALQTLLNALTYSSGTFERPLRTDGNHAEIVFMAHPAH
jgi:hypothetical protein